MVQSLSQVGDGQSPDQKILCPYDTYGTEDQDSIPGRGRDSFSSPPRPDRLWGPPNLLSNRELLHR